MSLLERDIEADTSLVVAPDHKNALAVFTADDATGADPLLSVVRGKIDKFLSDFPDVKTTAGRDAIRSFAHKVTKSKTALEAVGKKLAAEQKEIPKKIDATRRRIETKLDEWRDEVRKPLTDWEAAEEARVNAIKDNLAELQAVAADQIERSSECFRDRLGEILTDFADISEEKFGEYAGAAQELKATAIATLEARIIQAEKREADAAELTKLRAEQADRERKERDERIARDAADNARREAEQKAKAEQEAAQKREADLVAAAERAEQAKRDAEERAVRAAKEAKANAEREIREAQERDEAEQRRREADKAHRAKINRAALAALVEGGIAEDVAKTVIKLIAAKSVPAVSIQY